MLGFRWLKAVFLLSTAFDTTAGQVGAITLVADPGYAQWGKLAMEEASKAYPHSSIVDYKYEGKHSIAEGHVEERFKLWLRNGEREFGVRVIISIRNNSEEHPQVKIVEMQS